MVPKEPSSEVGADGALSHMLGGEEDAPGEYEYDEDDGQEFVYEKPELPEKYRREDSEDLSYKAWVERGEREAFFRRERQTSEETLSSVGDNGALSDADGPKEHHEEHGRVDSVEPPLDVGNE